VTILVTISLPRRILHELVSFRLDNPNMHNAFDLCNFYEEYIKMLISTVVISETPTNNDSQFHDSNFKCRAG
jgi:hypothetical protein